MKHSVFFDTDVLIDVFSKREPFYVDSEAILGLAETGDIKAYTSPLVIANVYYVLQKFGGKQLARHAILKIRKFIRILVQDEKTIDAAIDSEISDFEDALQSCTASQAQIRMLVTRNVRDFKKSQLSILSPKEALRFFMVS